MSTAVQSPLTVTHALPVPAPRRCTICGAPLERGKFESLRNYTKRLTCSLDCYRALRRASARCDCGAPATHLVTVRQMTGEGHMVRARLHVCSDCAAQVDYPLEIVEG